MGRKGRGIEEGARRPPISLGNTPLSRISPRSVLSRHEHTVAFLFVVPSLVVLSVLMFYPMTRVVQLSFLNASFVRPNPEFVGFKNYRDAIESAAFWKVMRNSVVWTAFVVGMQFVFGLAFALFLHGKGRATGLARSIVLIPWVVPGVVAGILWRLMYNPHIGVVNAFLLNSGIARQEIAFLANESTALPSVIVAAIWKGFPYSTVTYLAALQGVRRDLLEAAQIDGAGPAARLMHIVIPELSGIIRINLMLTTIWTFNYFDITYSMTRGGPNYATQIFPLEIYQQAFEQLRFSYSSALSVMSLLFIFGVTVFYVRDLRRRGEL